MNWRHQPRGDMNHNYFSPAAIQMNPFQNAVVPGWNGWIQQMTAGPALLHQSPQPVQSPYQNNPMGRFPNQSGMNFSNPIPPTYNRNNVNAVRHNVPKLNPVRQSSPVRNVVNQASQKRKWNQPQQNQQFGANFQQQQQQSPVNKGRPSKNKRRKIEETATSSKHDEFMSITDAPDGLEYEDKISLLIWKNYIDNRQTDRTYAMKRLVQKSLCAMLEDLGDNCVHIVGSTLNGFGSEKSDCDMCLHITSSERGLTKRMVQLVLTSVQRALQASRLFSDIQYIPARVPILKFRDRASAVDCDLNVNNTAGLFNTRLLALYSRFDWRVRPLGMFVKHWGRLCDVHDASRGRLSSYAFNLMVIQYLQHGCSPPVLPALQKDYPQLFRKSGSVHLLDMGMNDLSEIIAHWRRGTPENTMSLGQLAMGFFAYYVREIDFSKQALSVRLGQPIPISMALQGMPEEEVNRIQRGHYNYKMFMEEPFTFLNASRSPFDDSVYAIVKRAFIKTHRFLRQRKDIRDVAPV